MYRLGRLWIPWSSGSTHYAWLYYTEAKRTVEVLSNTECEPEELFNHAPQAVGAGAPQPER